MDDVVNSDWRMIMQIKIIKLRQVPDNIVNAIKNLVKKEEPTLSESYTEITIIFGTNKDIQKGRFQSKVKELLGQEPISLTKLTFEVSNVASPPKGIIEINLSKYTQFPNWKKKLSILHAVGHLKSSKNVANVFEKLRNYFSFETAKNLVRYQRQYFAHFCVIQNYPEQWLRSPVGFKKNTLSPKTFYLNQKKKYGKQNAVIDAFCNIVHLLSLLDLYKNIPDNLQKKLGNRKENAERFLDDFFSLIQIDTKTVLQHPKKWFEFQDFLYGDKYSNKIIDLLENQLKDQTIEKKTSNMPSIQFSHVAIGGRRSWRSEEMEKIKKANESEVTTILRLNLPFSLLRLPDGSYELKEEHHTYKLIISRVSRDPKIAKEITGWTPTGNIDIASDRFGRFSYSNVEIQIPYRIMDDQMFDYVCPNCQFEVSKTVTVCPSCNSTFTPEKSRIPPRKKIKIKAIEMINKFLDAYRVFFRDYFIEHIRYDDIISYEIEYKLSDGTTAKWQESFDLSYDGYVKTGSLTADKESIENFRALLSKPEERIILRDYLLSSSANRISTEEYHLAVLEAVIALEITLSDYVIKEMTKLELPKDKNEDFVRYIGSYGNTKVILRLLTKGKPQLDDSIYEKCEEAIIKRNKIVHKAETKATYNEAKGFLWNINKMIEYISRLDN